METIHVPVMPDEVLQYLDPQPGQIIIDGTLGGGGHTQLLAERVGPAGTIVAMDRDLIPVERARQSQPSPPVTPLHGSYHKARLALDQLKIDMADAMLVDLGLSSDQLEDSSRGFSFRTDGPLDLRFDIGRGESAADLLARLPEAEIANIIYRFGEERFSRRIAKRICERRRVSEPVRTAGELADLVRSCVPRSKNHSIDPATRTFQALRIAVNEELTILEDLLANAHQWLRPNGILVAISFHSLEDRIVKRAFRELDHWEPLTKKPVIATEQEIAANSRSRSAKLRAARMRPVA